MMDRVRLYLDDNRLPPDDGAGPWTIVRGIDAAKPLLERGVDEATLDHDLGQCAACKTDIGPDFCPHVGTGLDLVRWMAETGNWPRTRPRVHSQNGYFGPRMRDAIEALWRPPFLWRQHAAALGCGCPCSAADGCPRTLHGERRCVCACHLAAEALWWGAR